MKSYFFFLVFGFFFFVIFIVFSSKGLGADLTVVSEKAGLFASPDDSSPVGSLKKGKKVKATTNDAADGYYRLKTKSGKNIFIKASDVKLSGVEDDLVSEGDSSGLTRDGSSPDDFNRWSMSLSFSTGSYGGQTYSEAHLGIGYYFLRWIEFHNSFFANFNPTENYYGLDTSLRGVLNADLGVAGIHAFAGPGYRFVTKTQNLPFAEAGLIAKLLGFSLGGGVKTFFRSMINSTQSNHHQYFIVLSGGTSF